ncbi:MAG: undecaprenol kinase [Candidatus Paceibacteria bacterium]|jgi:undecaprenol kinase
MFKKYFNRFPHAFRGIIHAAKNDFGYRTQLYLGTGLGIIIAIILQPLEAWEFLFLILAWALILITELQNSALEAALDRLHPELHDDIKQIKDMAAGAVLTAGIFLLIVLFVIGYGRLI